MENENIIILAFFDCSKKTKCICWAQSIKDISPIQYMILLGFMFRHVVIL